MMAQIAATMVATLVAIFIPFSFSGVENTISVKRMKSFLCLGVIFLNADFPTNRKRSLHIASPPFGGSAVRLGHMYPIVPTLSQAQDPEMGQLLYYKGIRFLSIGCLF